MDDDNVTVRSTSKTGSFATAQASREPTIRDLFDLLTTMDRRTTEMDRRLCSIENELKGRVASVESSLEQAHHQIEALEGKVGQLEKHLADSNDLHHRQQILNELRSKEYNLLLHGIPQQQSQETAKETEVVVRSFLTETLRFPSSSLESIKFANIHRLPRRTSAIQSSSNEASKPPAIVIKFGTMRDKREIESLSASARSFGANITRHLPISMQQQRKDLIRQANISYKQGKTVKWKIIDADYCLYVNGERFLN